MKEWFSDRECNIRDSYEIRQGISRLAMLHGQLRQIPVREEWNMGSICIESLEKEQERHVREMKRARNFIRGKRGKTEFELCVIDSFDHFFDQAKEAVRQMNSLFPENGITDRLEAAELAPGKIRAISVTATWTSIMYLWEMVTQRLLNITACTWESRQKTCTGLCEK